MLLLPVGASEKRPVLRAITLALVAICFAVQLLSTALRPSEEALVAAEIAVEKAGLAILSRHGLVSSDAGLLLGYGERERRFLRAYPSYEGRDETLLENWRSAKAALRRLSQHDPAQRLAYSSDDLASINIVLAAFAHGDWLHLLTNMLVLVLFGSIMELRWGRWVYLLLYLGGALASVGAFLLVNHQRDFVVLGASGAVAAAMGAMLVSCFGRDIRYWYALPARGGWRTGTFSFPSILVLPIWIVEQVASMQLESMALTRGIALSGHLGGFVFGVLLAWVLHQTGLEQRLLPAGALPSHDEPDPSLAASEVLPGDEHPA